MRFISGAMTLLVFCIPALGQENTKSFTYTKTKQADLEMIVHFPPGWKETDKRPGIVFFFGGGWENGTIKAFARLDHLWPICSSRGKALEMVRG